jgi:hypothetical protein
MVVGCDERLRVKGFELLKKKKGKNIESESGFGCLTEKMKTVEMVFYFYFDRN